jgi:hypothetical protein
MTDMMLGLQDRERADAPLWSGWRGREAPASGRDDTASGPQSKARVAVAPDWVGRLADYLRKIHPLKTADAVSARCRGQITTEQVRKWLNRGAKPGGEALLWLATAYGPSLLVACFGPCPISATPEWLAIAMKAERVDELGQRLQAMRAELDEALSRRDGR